VNRLADATATELLDLYRTGAASPVDAVQACLERIDAVEPEINAVLTLLGDRALAQAADSADRWARGEARPFEGVPYGLKDIVATRGVRTTGGSSLYRDLCPTESASLAGRLEDAGGVLVAKLQTYEFACGGSLNRTFGVVRNPWALDRSTGGSSSGSAAAVAARELPVAIGTDTGGSIRIPAAWCGLVGLKATFGRVPRHGVMGLSWTLDHAGPMTRTVADTALTLGVIAGHDPRDATTSMRPVGDFLAACSRPVAGLRIGVPGNWFFDRIHPAVADAFEESVRALRDLGLEPVELQIPAFEHVEAVGWTVLYAEMMALHEPHLPTIEDRDAACSDFLAVAPFVAAGDYLKALRVRALLQRGVQRAFELCDVLATPGVASVAPPLDAMACDLGEPDPVPWLDAAPRTTLPFNVTGNPAIVVPAGLVDGLPVSLQLVGRPYDEETVLAVAAAYEAATGHDHRAPPLLAGVG
jgi:aspartyl-tRNA(Asn)/glutamyl-tRNA(Gln) amidotransferase subunit A